MSEVLVIDLRSLSYTGTTWINLLIGSHPSAFTLGAPQRAYGARRGEIDPSKLCRVHGASCSFWPAAFASGAFGDMNLYREVAAAAVCDVVVVNNPFVDAQGVSDLSDDGVADVTFAIVRDPKAVVWSHHRRHGTTPQQSARWLVDHAYLAPVDDAPVIRYEEAAADPSGLLARVGAAVGLDYPADAVNYFGFPHHPVGGNPTPFAVIARHLANTASSDPEVEARYQQAVTSPSTVTLTEGWRGFSADDLDMVSEIVDPVAQRWGYR